MKFLDITDKALFCLSDIFPCHNFNGQTPINFIVVDFLSIPDCYNRWWIPV